MIILHSQHHFFSQVASWEPFLDLFDLDPGLCFYIKDVAGNFVRMNASLRKLLGEKDDQSYIGKNDKDYFTPDLVFRYLEEDQLVYKYRKPILNQPWIVTNKQGQRNWYISSKIPLFDSANQVIGLAGLMRDYTQTKEILKPFHEMQSVISHIFANFHGKITISELASMMYLSVSQFERRFREIFRITPLRFILKVRLDSAVQLLMTSDLSITQVALQCGFYDSSSFARQFHKVIGQNPSEFRRKFLRPMDFDVQ